MANNSKTGKIVAIAAAVVLVVLAVFVYFHFFFVYSSGINAGEINYVQREGIVFKTYEGKMIQSGFKSTGSNTGDLRSNEFKFSVADKSVAERLMRCSGKHVELRWNRYFGKLPWRGKSQFVVYEVLTENEQIIEK